MINFYFNLNKVFLLKILIIGGNGVIGSKIRKNLPENKFKLFSTYMDHKSNSQNEFFLDIRHKENVEKIFLKIQPDMIIHTSAITNIDLCEENHELADSVNIKGTENIIKFSEKINSKLIFVSTSFVFDGKKSIYHENDITNPTTYYGKTKEISEKNIINSNLDYLIIRTDQPYCWIEPWQHTNSVLRVIDTLKAKKNHREIIDWYNTPTYVPDFVKTTQKLITNNKSGIYHVIGSDYISRFEWAKKICEYFNLNQKLIIPIKSQELMLSAKRVNVNLSNDKISTELGVKMMGIEEGLKSMLKEKNLY